MNVREIHRRGLVEFLGFELLVAPGVLVPRPETELLARAALQELRDLRAPRVIDMCCGSGNLACGIALLAPHAELWASDLEPRCIEVARRNVERLDLSRRVRLGQGDLFAGLRGFALEGSIDAVVCNPPYISARRLEGDSAALLEHEPRAAFDGGPYGLSVHQRVIREAPGFLRAGGVLLFEIGLGQDRQLRALFARATQYEGLRLLHDAEGQARVALARRKGQA